MEYVGVIVSMVVKIVVLGFVECENAQVDGYEVATRALVVMNETEGRLQHVGLCVGLHIQGMPEGSPLAKTMHPSEPD